MSRVEICVGASQSYLQRFDSRPEAAPRPRPRCRHRDGLTGSSEHWPRPPARALARPVPPVPRAPARVRLHTQRQRRVGPVGIHPLLIPEMSRYGIRLPLRTVSAPHSLALAHRSPVCTTHSTGVWPVLDPLASPSKAHNQALEAASIQT